MLTDKADGDISVAAREHHRYVQLTLDLTAGGLP